MQLAWLVLCEVVACSSRHICTAFSHNGAPIYSSAWFENIIKESRCACYLNQLEVTQRNRDTFASICRIIVLLSLHVWAIYIYATRAKTSGCSCLSLNEALASIHLNAWRLNAMDMNEKWQLPCSHALSIRLLRAQMSSWEQYEMPTWHLAPRCARY